MADLYGKNDKLTQEEAVGIIQAVQRGRTARGRVADIREYKEKVKAAEQIQALTRGRQVRQDLRRQGEAAQRIQAVARGSQVRQDLRRQGEAAQRIQAVARGSQIRQDLRRQGEAAQRIQAVARGSQVRQDLRRQGEAAQRIQAVARGRQVMNELERIRNDGKNPQIPPIEPHLSPHSERAVGSQKSGFDFYDPGK